MTNEPNQPAVVQEASARLEQLIAKWREVAHRQRREVLELSKQGAHESAAYTEGQMYASLHDAAVLEDLLPEIRASETQRHALTEGLRELSARWQQFIDEEDNATCHRTREDDKADIDALLASSPAGTPKE